MQRNKNENINNQDPEQNNNAPGSNGSTSTQGIPSYLAAAARIPTSYPLGADKVDKSLYSFGNRSVKDTDSVPGIMVVNYVPTYGVSESPNSAVNRAAAFDFNRIRSMISGTRPYQPVDAMIERIAVSSLRELYLYVRRVYAILGGYYATNLYRPRYILEAMGLDFDNWRKHASDLYQWLLNNQHTLKPFPLAPIGNITDRHAVFNTYLFTDGEVDTAQTYILNQKVFYSYEVVDQVKGLTAKQMPSTYEEFIMLWDTMYKGLSNSSDVYIISADIRRAFPDSYVTELPDTAADQTVEYLKVDSVLTSLMNASIIGAGYRSANINFGVDNLGSFRIMDDKGFIRCSPSVSSDHPSNWTDLTEVRLPMSTSHLNFVQDNPETSDILDAFRLKVLIKNNYFSWSKDSAGGKHIIVAYRIKSMGTEVVTGITIYNKKIGNLNDGNKIDICGANIFRDDDTFNSAARILRDIDNLSNFDWHPPVGYSTFEGSDENTFDPSVDGHVIEDIQNYVPISDDDIIQIHDAMLLAAFGVSSDSK